MTKAKTKVTGKASGKASTKAKAKANPVGCPRQWQSVEAMSEAIENYFAKCDARTVPMVVGKALVRVPKPEPYIVQKLAVFLDLTTKGLIGYEQREEFGATIKRAKARIEANKVLHMLDGDGYGPGYIFDLKNNYGWKDKQDLEINVLNSPAWIEIQQALIMVLQAHPEALEDTRKVLAEFAGKGE